jgi:hypothetical protein
MHVVVVDGAPVFCNRCQPEIGDKRHLRDGRSYRIAYRAIKAPVVDVVFETLPAPLEFLQTEYPA